MAPAPILADDVIERLHLRTHPEGGWYAETWRADPGVGGGRAAGSAIFFLLRAGEVSAWHRVDAAEIWHHYAGAPLELRIAGSVATSAATAAATGDAASVTPGSTDSASGPPEAIGGVAAIRLGDDLTAGETPQSIVPPGAWQSARSLGDWTLVGCTVSPAFEFAGFELAPDGWEP